MVAANSLYQSARNFELGVRVVDALLLGDETRFDQVSAIAFCGIVELSGAVSTLYDKLRAIEIAEQVPGVSTVVESLQVRPLFRTRRSTDRYRSRPFPSEALSVNSRRSRGPDSSSE